MWNLLKKDKKKRYNYSKKEKKKKVFYFLRKNNIINYKKKIKINHFIFKWYQKNSSFVECKNRCLITARSKSVYRQFKLSRCVIKKWLHLGNLYGWKKASW